MSLCHLILLPIASLTFRNTEYTLCIYTEGCVFKTSQKKFRVIRWQEIEHIWCTVAHTPGSVFKVHRLYKLQSHNGKILSFCGKMSALSDFDQRSDEYYTQRRVPACLDDHQAGRSLRFGLLTLNLNGLAIEDRTLAWEQSADISLQKKRWLTICAIEGQQTPWLHLAASKIPDLPLLLALLAHLRPTQAVYDEPPALATSQGRRTAVQERKQLLRSQLPAKKEPGPAAQKRKLHLTEMPDDLLVLACEHRLGERRTDGPFGSSTLMTRPFIVAQVIICLFFTIFSLIMIYMVFSPQHVESGWEQIQDAIARDIVWFSMGVSWLGFFLSVLLHIHHSTYAFEQGLILKRGRRVALICRWDEVETVWRAKWPVSLPPFYAGYTLRMRNGSPLTLTRFDLDLEALGTIVREQITPLQLPASRCAYQSGQKLSFGSLRVSQVGIEQGKRLLPWSQVKSVMLEAHTLTIYDLARRKPWYAVHTARVPNLSLFFALADEARGDGERL